MTICKNIQFELCGISQRCWTDDTLESPDCAPKRSLSGVSKLSSLRDVKMV